MKIPDAAKLSTRDRQRPDRSIRTKQSQLAKAYKLLREQAHLLNSTNDAIAIVKLDGTIHYWNKGAERLYGFSKRRALGKVAAVLLSTEFPETAEEIMSELLSRGYWQGELRQARRDGVRVSVSSRWSLCRDRRGKPSASLQISSNITEHKRAEEQLRRLSAYLLRLQDEERRKIARELHDSVGQLLAALDMNLMLVQRDTASAEERTQRAIAESLALVAETAKEIRSMSYLLHPPLLDHAGLAAAVRWYADGFSQRSGIEVELALQHDLGELSQEVQITSFRIVQECLTNIHRHSGSRVASITISRVRSELRLEVQDQGKGFAVSPLKNSKPAAAVPGVGILGMRERVRQLGGRLFIRSNGGTRVEVFLPIGKKNSGRAKDRRLEGE